MKIINETIEGRFIKRLNRFEALVSIGGSEALVHVPNTGRCKELLYEGVRVILEIRKGAHRKTGYELIMVYKQDQLISIDSQAPNKIVEEAVRMGMVPQLAGYSVVQRERTYKNSRFDLLLSGAQPDTQSDCFVEVKGVTLERNGLAIFPDAPTERGAKHIKELIAAKADGYRAVVFFLIQMNLVEKFTPNDETDKTFSDNLRNAAQSGVEILAYNCRVNENEVLLNQEIKINLNYFL